MYHGLADSSDAFIMNTEDKAPAFVAAAEGYDIWLPNSRGNKYSRNHTWFNPDFDAEYWDHSFIEQA